MRNVYSAGFVLFTATIGSGIIVPLLPMYATSMGATPTQVGIIFGMFSFSRLAVLVFTPWLMSRFSVLPLLMTGASIYLVSSFCYAAAGSVGALILIRFFHGFGSGLITPVVFSIGASAAPKGEEGKTMGVVNFFFLTGLGIGPLAGGGLHHFFGTTVTFFGLGALAAAGLVIIMVRLRGVNVPTPNRRLTFFEPRIRVLGSMRFFYAFAIGLNWSFIPFLLARITDSVEMLSGIYLSILVLVGAFGQTIAGRFSDRMNKRKIITVSSFGVAVLLATLPFVHAPTLLFAYSVMYGFVGAFFLNSVSAYAVIAGRDVGQGNAMSALLFYHSVGISISPVIAGLVMQSFGLTTVFVAYAVLILVAPLLLRTANLESGDEQVNFPVDNNRPKR